MLDPNCIILKPTGLSNSGSVCRTDYLFAVQVLARSSGIYKPGPRSTIDGNDVFFTPVRDTMKPGYCTNISFASTASTTAYSFFLNRVSEKKQDSADSANSIFIT